MTADQRAGGPDFATLLRQRRGEAGLTQADLAGRAGLAVRTVRDVERGRTARVQRSTATLLADALGLVGGVRDEFLSAARGEGEVPPDVGGRPGAAAARGVPLPPAPALFGRDAEVVSLVELVAAAPGPTAPVSLVGVAGVGKSALALAVAHRVADRFPGGVAGVTIDHASVASEVVDAVGSVFGAPRHDLLRDRVAGGPALLLLDAVDRASGEVGAVLARLPSTMRVLATGRGPLGLAEERVWPVVPLELPPPATDVDLSEVAGFPAAALFLERLRRVRPEPLAAEEVAALVGLVRRLGGLPLALELAAAHGRLLRLPQILQRYGDRVLDLPGGPDLTVPSGSADALPPAPLREAVAGSYRLLAPVEQRALRRLAAFRNRWSVELAEQLLSEPPGQLAGGDPVPLLDRLVGLGLVGARGVRENRFRLLDVVRDFATEQAERHSELGSARRAHAVVVARFVSRAAPELAGAGMPAAVTRLDDLAGEVWSALSYAANDDPHTALWLASNLPRWWRIRGRDRAGQRWLRRLLDDPRTADADPVVRAWAQLGLAQLAQAHGEGGAERAAVEAALAGFRRAGDVGGELTAYSVLGAVSWADRRYDEARAHTEAALVVATRGGRLRDAAVAQHNLLWHEIRVADLAAARRRLAAVDRLAAQSGEQRVRVLAAANLAEVARLEGRYEEAVAVGGRVLARLSELGDPRHRRQVLGTLGQSLAALGRVGEAERALATLRTESAAEAGPDGGRMPTTEGVCAVIEARLALARGDQLAAAEWFAAAAAAFRGGQDPRDLVESLVCLAAGTTDPEARRRVLAELEQVTQEGGFVLLPRERKLLEGGS